VTGPRRSVELATPRARPLFLVGPSEILISWSWRRICVSLTSVICPGSRTRSSVSVATYLSARSPTRKPSPHAGESKRTTRATRAELANDSGRFGGPRAAKLAALEQSREIAIEADVERLLRGERGVWRAAVPVLPFGPCRGSGGRGGALPCSRRARDQASPASAGPRVQRCRSRVDLEGRGMRKRERIGRMVLTARTLRAVEGCVEVARVSALACAGCYVIAPLVVYCKGSTVRTVIRRNAQALSPRRRRVPQPAAPALREPARRWRRGG
jgi:hypothetical protein